eukprot:UN30092
MGMEYVNGTVLCLDKKAWGDSKECAHNPNEVFRHLNEIYSSHMKKGFILNMTTSILELLDTLRSRNAFLEDFTASNMVFDKTGQVHIIDFDSIIFYDSGPGFLSGLGCLDDTECSVPKSWTLNHGFADNTLGLCQEKFGVCNNETRICQGFTADWMLCGMSNWIFKKLYQHTNCNEYLSMTKCTSEYSPNERCSAKKALHLLKECTADSQDMVPVMEESGSKDDITYSADAGTDIDTWENNVSDEDEEKGGGHTANDEDVPNVGYQTYRNYPRWEGMFDFITNIEMEPEVVIDYGSNSGFFSMKFAKTYNSKILALDTNACYKKIYPMTQHWEESKKLDMVDQHSYCVGSWKEGLIDKLYNTGKKIDVQLVLSIFHWLRIKEQEKADKYLEP